MRFTITIDCETDDIEERDNGMVYSPTMHAAITSLEATLPFMFDNVMVRSQETAVEAGPGFRPTFYVDCVTGTWGNADDLRTIQVEQGPEAAMLTNHLDSLSDSEIVEYAKQHGTYLNDLSHLPNKAAVADG